MIMKHPLRFFESLRTAKTSDKHVAVRT